MADVVIAYEQPLQVPGTVTDGMRTFMHACVDWSAAGGMRIPYDPNVPAAPSPPVPPELAACRFVMDPDGEAWRFLKTILTLEVMAAVLIALIVVFVVLPVVRAVWRRTFGRPRVMGAVGTAAGPGNARGG